MFQQKHRLCPACDARVAAGAVQCPECETRLTPVRRFDVVRVTLALTCVLVLAAGAVWALTVKDSGDPDVPLVAPRDWWSPDSAGLALDSAIERRFGANDTAQAADSVILLSGRRTEGCEPYRPGRDESGSGGRSGPVRISNRSDRAILLTIYRPDGEGWSSIQRRVPAGRTTFLTSADGKRVIAHTDWGVQVNAYCVELFDEVAGWAGGHFTLTWGGPGAEQ